jgi:UDP-glucuronate 4-epimerase
MILVTGAAGFIGFHVVRKLLDLGNEVVGVDNLNEYYDPSLKKARLALLMKNKAFHFHECDIADFEAMSSFFKRYAVSRVCHLAAQAGVRYSLTNPFAYEKSNGEGFLSIIECARHHHSENFVYASSSSVYGANTKIPFSESTRKFPFQNRTASIIRFPCMRPLNGQMN